MKTGFAAALALATLALATLAPASALAVESGTGAYLLGTRGMAAGFVPGPGVYISDSIIYLQSRTRQDISIGGAIVADPSIAALVNLAAVTVVPDMPAFGGTAALSVVVPYAGVDMDFSGRFLGGPQGATLHDSQDGFGDIAITPTIGWHDGYWNYSGAITFFLPTGEYSTAEVKPRQGIFDVLSISKNKFAVDPTLAVTWLNPNIGLEGTARSASPSARSTARPTTRPRRSFMARSRSASTSGAASSSAPPATPITSSPTTAARGPRPSRRRSGRRACRRPSSAPDRCSATRRSSATSG